ncbi:MAG: sulfatase [Verrucomicrobiota bacterium]
MQRRDFLQTSSAVATASAAAPVLAQGASKPNLLIIHCDELNFRTLGCYRETLAPEQAFMWGTESVVETPHIDSIAKEGVLCTKFYAATPVCSPSRSSFISGRYPQNTPVTTNSIPLDDEIVSFAETLGNAGYATGYAGKWHLDGTGKPQWAPERKFGFEDNRYMFNRGHWKQFEETEDGPRVKARDAKGNPTYSVKGADRESFATDFLTDRTIEFIDDNQAESFCYMLSIPDPHGPDTVRAPYDAMFDDDVVEKPRTYDKEEEGVPSWAAPQKCNYNMANYRGMMKCIDDCVGRLLDALRERNLLDQTIVVFTADHGDMRGEHHRQNKGIPLEASAKVPFVARFPEKIAGGTRVDEVINTVDFLPTMLAMMGVATAGKEEGRDASPLLTSAAKGEVPWKNVTFMRGTGRPGSSEGWISAVTPRHKLILSSKDKPWLLDLETDPDELINYIDDQPEVAKALAQDLLGYADKNGDIYLDHPRTRQDLDAILA